MIAVIGAVLALSALSVTDASGTTSRLQVQVSDNVCSWEPMVGRIHVLHVSLQKEILRDVYVDLVLNEGLLGRRIE
jgi:hypothetical protein